MDGFFFSDQPFRANQSISQDSVVYIVDETLPMKDPGSILPLDVVALGPNDMGEDFYHQNTQSWRLQPRFHTRLGISLVGSDMLRHARSFPAGPVPDNSSVSSVLQLSRAGFNRKGTLALLYYSYRCGWLCGQSGWVVLHKTDGNWSIREFGSGKII